MEKKSWAHQELPSKKVIKYAATLSVDEIRAAIESNGSEPVFVGNDFESGHLLWVLDNTVFNKYQIMVEINEDPVWDYAVKRYVFMSKYRKFGCLADLQDYVGRLNLVKYGRS